MWFVFMIISIIIMIFGQYLPRLLLNSLISLTMTLKFFMDRQSMDDVKFHEMHKVKTKREAIRMTIYIIMIGLYYGANFITSH